MNQHVLATFLQGTSYTVTSFCFFYILNWIITQFVTPDHLKDDVIRKWRWRNYAVSFIHSSLSGTLGLICLWLQPALLDDIIGGYSEFAYITVCVTFGYFWYDTVDLILNSDKEKSNRELVVHHAFALTSASILVYTKTFVGFGVVSLMIELHSVTLHARVLLKLYTRSQITLAYQIVKWSNIFTFFVFRFATIFYLFYALHRDRYSAFNYVIYTFLCLATTVIFLLSCQLFMRVLQADFLPKKVEKKTTEELLEVTTPQCLVSGPEKTPM